MRNQRTPNIDDNRSLDAIANAKQGKRRTRLHNIKDEVCSAYGNYIKNKSNLGTMTPIALGKHQKKDLEHCYSSHTLGLSNLKTSIKDNLGPVDRELCPYCGVREPSEFDHYLPKSKFQEFSVFSKNLIWSCHRCNHQKKEHFSASDRYLNTYFDIIPKDQFLFCFINTPIEENGISFSFEKPQSITQQQYNDLLSHARKLKLLDTYKQMACQKLPNWLKKWRILAEMYSKSEFKNHLFRDLEADIQVETTRYGENYYKRVLKVGVKSRLDEIVEHLYD